jgi:hypothetical protein
LLGAERKSDGLRMFEVEVEMSARGESGLTTVRGKVAVALLPRSGELIQLSPALVVRIDQVLHIRGGPTTVWASVVSGEPPTVHDLSSVLRSS